VIYVVDRHFPAAFPCPTAGSGQTNGTSSTILRPVDQRGAPRGRGDYDPRKIWRARNPRGWRRSPVAWYRHFEGARIFVSALVTTPSSTPIRSTSRTLRRSLLGRDRARHRGQLGSRRHRIVQQVDRSSRQAWIRGQCTGSRGNQHSAGEAIHRKKPAMGDRSPKSVQNSVAKNSRRERREPEETGALTAQQATKAKPQPRKEVTPERAPVPGPRRPTVSFFLSFIFPNPPKPWLNHKTPQAAKKKPQKTAARRKPQARQEESRLTDRPARRRGPRREAPAAPENATVARRRTRVRAGGVAFQIHRTYGPSVPRRKLGAAAFSARAEVV